MPNFAQKVDAAVTALSQGASTDENDFIDASR